MLWWWIIGAVYTAVGSMVGGYSSEQVREYNKNRKMELDILTVFVATSILWPIFLFGMMGAGLASKQISKKAEKALRAAEMEKEHKLAMKAYEEE